MDHPKDHIKKKQNFRLCCKKKLLCISQSDLFVIILYLHEKCVPALFFFQNQSAALLKQTGAQCMNMVMLL